MRCALLVLLLAALAAGSHFRGTTISWSSDKNTTGLVHFSFRIAWRRSYSSAHACTHDTIRDGDIHGSGGDWTSDIDGSLSTTQYYCTDFSLSEDWTTGENSFDYVFSDTQPREVSYASCCWISVNVHGAEDWRARTLVDLSPRNDTGQPNSSPISASAPIVRIIQQCDAVIRIPAEDPDGDAVRCRWGNGSAECGGVCGALPNVTLDEETCTLYYNAAGGMATGWWAVALVLEDFSRSPSCSSPPFPPECGPLSQIPLQFLFFVEASSSPCIEHPELVGRTPADQGCIGIPTGDTYTAVIEAEAGGSGVTISEIQTVSPLGMTRSSLTVDPNNPQRFSITVTWTPTAQQAGQNVFCFSALDSVGFHSDQRCVTLLAGEAPPVAMLETRAPTQQVHFDQEITWSLTFDVEPELPPTPRFIRFFDDTDMEVYTIDTSTSSDVQISGNTLSFTTPPNVFSQGDHYILMDAGVVVSPSNCAASGPPFVGISDSSTWTFQFIRACPVGYGDDYGFGKCLRVLKRPLTYYKAKAHCECRGGRVFQLDNAADVNKTKTILERVRTNVNRYVGMWVGLTDETTEGTFAWEDGTPLDSGDFSDWAPQPYDHNSKRRDCVQMKRKFNWQWVVRSCRRVKNLFLCEPN